jgi:hypothetical protein
VITHASHPQVVTIPRGRERRIRQASVVGEVGRRAFVSGKRKQNTIKTTTIADKQPGRCGVGAVRPGRMHDQTAVKTEGIADLLASIPMSRSPSTRATGAGHGVPRSGPCPARKPPKNAPAEQVAVYKQAQHQQSSRRICVEHAVAEHKQWRPLQRWIGRREYYGEVYLAIAGLVSDRAARRWVKSPGVA